MRALILVHRWLGVVFCLVFAMWFATGIVMHFVSFPALTEAERIGGLGATQATFAELAAYDQWTVSNGLDPHRPLYRIALNDGARTELYVSSVTGEVVRDTTRSERAWNYAGSVLHWIYPTVLRRDQH